MYLRKRNQKHSTRKKRNSTPSPERDDTIHPDEISSDDAKAHQRMKHKNDVKKVSSSDSKGKGKFQELSTLTDHDSDEQQPPLSGRRQQSSSARTCEKNKKILIEDTKSNSSEEFQKSKVTRCGYSTLKKIADKSIKVGSSAVSTKQKTIISKEQSFQFKSAMTKILNRYKEICTDFELNMERLKCYKFRKDLEYLESANNIVFKATELVTALKKDLDNHHKEMEEFNHSWSEKVMSKASKNQAHSCSEDQDEENEDIVYDSDRDIDIEKSLTWKNLDSKKDEGKENQETLVLLPKTSTSASNNEEKEARTERENESNKEAMSECDSEEIFSDTENEKRIQPPHNHDPSGNKNIFANSTDLLTPTRNEKSADDPLISSTSSTPIILDLDNGKKSGKYKEDDNVGAVKSNASRLSSAMFESNESVNDIFDISVDTTTSTPTNTLNPSNIEEEIDDDMLPPDNDKIVRTKEAQGQNDKLNVQEESLSETDTGAGDENHSNVNPKMIPVSDGESSSELELFLQKGQGRKCSGSSLEGLSSASTPDVTEKEQMIKEALLNSNSDDSMELSESPVLGRRKSENAFTATIGEGKKETCSKQKRSTESSSSETHKKASDKEFSAAPERDDDEARKNTNWKENPEKKSSDNVKRDSFNVRIKEQQRARLSSNDAKYLTKYASDPKLQQICKVLLTRLPKEHEKSSAETKQQSLDKEIRSLIDLNALEKSNKPSRKSGKGSGKSKLQDISDEDDTLLDHLRKVEETDALTDANEESGSDADKPEISNQNKNKNVIQTFNELLSEANDAKKNCLLDSSDSDLNAETQKTSPESSDHEDDKNQKERKSTKTGRDTDNKDHKKDPEKGKWKQDELLTMRISDSESDVSSKNKKNRRKEKQGNTNSDEESSVEKKQLQKKHKRKVRRRIFESDSDSAKMSDSDASKMSIPNSDAASDASRTSHLSKGKQKNKRSRKRNQSTDSNPSEPEIKTKRKRKRLKQMTSESDDSDKDPLSGKEDDNDQLNSSQSGSGKKGRKNIRKVLKDTKVAADTKQAAKEEEERLKRIAERQKLYTEMYEARLAGEEKLEKLVLDFDPKTKEAVVSVHKDIVKHLKPHQAKGIKFMWDSCFESLEHAKKSSGSGCLLAHCMGLGKTLQVIALVHTLLTHEDTGIKKILVVCPLSTVLNWANEFKHWLSDVEYYDDIEIYELTKHKKNIERMYRLQAWQRTGGVLIMGYDMFRNLTGTNRNIKKKMKEQILECLIDPGPDIVVCDEGHLLKNEDTALSKCMKAIKTRRRIVLTGTPLQNNLVEYHCMIQFVKPNLLGTRKEFSNRFVHPITNGQFDDSTERDVKLMKKRAYVLNKMLKGSVQRFDYSVLTPFLPPKQEYVIFVTLSEVQINIYRHYIENLARKQGTTGRSLFADFQALQRIWTHPLVLRFNAEKIEKANEKNLSESESSLADFIDDGTDNSSSSEDSSEDDEVQECTENGNGISTRGNSKNRSNWSDEERPNPPVEEIIHEKPWWDEYVRPEHFEDMRVSAKLVLLFEILNECENIGDKLLVFSQSLYSLRLIEEFLKKIDSATDNDTNPEYLGGHKGNWTLGADYFRLDGQTPAENRSNWCKIFNRPNNTRARLFLISTRAGGLGINLTAANRVVIFDASWNPSHDVQSIFRVYRFGQKKPCYVYRFLAAGTMEEKIYSRQVTKLSLACRVVDEQQIERHYTNHALNELYVFEPNLTGEKPTLNLPKDRLLAEIFLKHKAYVENYHEHDSLLENKTDEELDEEERKQAWLEYEEERTGPPRPPQLNLTAAHVNAMGMAYGHPSNVIMNVDYKNFQELIRKDFPNASPHEHQVMTARAIKQMYDYYERQTFQRQHAGISMPAQNPMRVWQHQAQMVANPRPTATLINPFANNAGATRLQSTQDDDIMEVVPVATNAPPVQLPQSAAQPADISKNQEE